MVFLIGYYRNWTSGTRLKKKTTRSESEHIDFADRMDRMADYVQASNLGKSRRRRHEIADVLRNLAIQYRSLRKRVRELDPKSLKTYDDVQFASKRLKLMEYEFSLYDREMLKIFQTLKTLMNEKK